MKKQLPPRDIQWIDDKGRPTDIFYDFIKDLEKRTLGQPVSNVGTPVNGQFLVYNTVAGIWALQPETPPTDGQVLIWNAAAGKWIAGTN